VVVIPMAALEPHVGQDDPVAQVGPPSAGSLRQFPRMIASPIRAARTFGPTSWTRTTSTPPAMANAVVASVASSP
jgi:hypothetical protein